MSRVVGLVTFLVVLVVVATTVVGAAVTEVDIKKMKIKELKSFLEARGQVCKGCQEKADFVKMALQHMHTPATPNSAPSSSGPSGPSTRRPIPEGTFWDIWANNAKEMCLAAAKKESLAEAKTGHICDSIAGSIDGLFMRIGKRTAAQLKKKPDALLKTSYLDVYYPATRRTIARIIGFCFKPANQETCSSASKLEALLEKETNPIKHVNIKAFLTNVGIENTNPMYDILKEKNVAHEEL